MAASECEPPKLIPLGEVPQLGWLPHRRGGKPLHISTLYRWVSPGLKGHRLRVVRGPGGLATTSEWLLEFFEDVAGGTSAPAAPTRSRSDRERAIRAAEKQLNAAGV